jgi:hypothetical protein
MLTEDEIEKLCVGSMQAFEEFCKDAPTKPDAIWRVLISSAVLEGLQMQRDRIVVALHELSSHHAAEAQEAQTDTGMARAYAFSDAYRRLADRLERGEM